ncbi:MULTISPECIES: molybdopterin-dependent oxidoreductase [unclassified Undibacterium]|uniref:molybdopterin-dependent oxidoreductase n=2 Tax=Bacteria TaxID=2 RepID=UPI002AC8970E|nr:MULTISPECIES: molybdopterin-dependent oxidoreductase [unclassified Undibacterium]MEB0138504.1 molybdopterin-dependent oxidoreductase [Undibacterium sp. CCC2.1]MEB0173095.1 molybdopterin-dependent oxidoreductase [Undibacterium sp. CCC1.1]MEB0176147.1 molybdopterin-dependent oxidoreductase [Undibacterium sp. CCC3.4]MEB0215413.1 molybdopterin-dependent oxidoreductase [Undibacterium sp. 5I2]WPX42754.1 molybdopterin-dependent oxidoreductase [Undibacterium sp. CCC3.4]
MNLDQTGLVTGTVCTTCPYCGVGCGVRASVGADGGIAIAGDPDHPANAGRLCVKGSALDESLSLDGRLLQPQMRDAASGLMQTSSWEQALSRVASGFADIIAQHGADAVALYVSGQLLTEDYYIANKLMKGFIGTANIDTNSRLCMSSAVAGHKRAFGADLVPVCYDDLELADLVVLVGSNTAWCHPILFQRIAKIKESRPAMKLVVIDPRRTATSDLADLHLPLKPGSDVWLFNGLLDYLSRNGYADQAFVAAHTQGGHDALQVAAQSSGDVLEVAQQCKLDPAQIEAFYALFAGTKKVITAFSQGVNQSSSGTDKVNSIINCHLLSARIGQPGMGPFSLTGQPNAMGGREVGGLANLLAAHMELNNEQHRETVQSFWNAPRIAERPGLKAVELFQAIEQGRIKAVWIIATNPVVSLPDADQVQRALAKCELVVVSDIVSHTDTNAWADVLLPALGWGEKDGTVTNSERCISRQRAFLSAPGAARPDWRILCDVAQKMAYSGFDYQDVHEIFDEHARLSAFRNGSGSAEVPRVFNLSGLTGMSKAQYDALAPVQWPVTRAADGQPRGTARLFSDGKFTHADGKARFIATPPRPPVHAPNPEYPLILNTGRVRDQWHTMTRTGKAAKLADHTAESFIDMHPQDALLCGVREGSLARVSSPWGAMVAKVQHGGGIARGSIFVPIHWSNQTTSDGRIGAVVNPVVDPVSGEPEFKHTPVRVEEFPVSWYGFILTRRELALDEVTHWTRIQGREMLRYELAGRKLISDPSAWARQLMLATDVDADWLDYADDSAGVYRAVHLVDERIDSCIFLSPRADLPARAWLAGLFAKQRLDEIDRVGLLLGQTIAPGIDAGPTICSCYGVGRNTICHAIREHGMETVAQVTNCLKAGGNCGSCVPEIKKLLALVALEAAVEQSA